MRKLILTLASVIAIAASARAALAATELRLVAFGRPPLAPMASPLSVASDSVVVFLDEQPRMAAELVVVPEGALPAPSLDRWWQTLTVEISDKNGIARTVPVAEASLLEARVRGELVRGERSTYGRWFPRPTFVRFAVAPLPPGDYAARARVTLASGLALRSDATVFHIRRGDEDLATKRLYLRAQADRARSYAAYKAVMLQLLALEPENAGIVESIAERSLNNAPSDETLGFYKQAHAMREKAAAKTLRERGDRLTDADRRSIEQQLLAVSLFEKIYPDYQAHRADRRLVILGAGPEKKYAWFSKEGGMIGVIDPRNPATVRPIEMRDRRP